MRVSIEPTAIATSRAERIFCPENIFVRRGNLRKVNLQQV